MLVNIRMGSSCSYNSTCTVFRPPQPTSSKASSHFSDRKLKLLPRYKNVDEDEPLPVSTNSPTLRSKSLNTNDCAKLSKHAATDNCAITNYSNSPLSIDSSQLNKDLQPTAIVQRRRRSQQFSIDEGGCLKSPSHGGILPSPMAGLDPIYPVNEEGSAASSGSSYLLSPDLSHRHRQLVSPRRSSSQCGSRHPLIKMTPKIMYNNSVDKLSANTAGESRRPILSNLPYSPQSSPCHSPLHRVKRQPTRESRSVSIVEDEDGYMQLNQYRIRRDLGKGSYGMVKLAYNDNDSNHYALKMLSKKKMMRTAGLLRRLPPRRKNSIEPGTMRNRSPSPSPQNQNPLHRVYQEIAIQKKLDHPNIVKLVEVLDDPEQDCIYSVFELVSRGSVMDVYRGESIPEDIAWNYFRDTLLGLEYLHYQKVVHRDIKPSNLLLTDDGHIKICDFGVSSEFSGDDVYLRNTAGSPAFMAPESVSETQTKVFGGKALDIWALGITLYSFIYSKVPFDQPRIVDLYHSIVHDKIHFPEEQKVSDELKDIICKMLEKEPLKRITIPELREHPWVTQNGKFPLISTQENCQEFVEVSEFDVSNCIRFIPKLETLIKVKLILHRRSFRNPLHASDNSRESSCTSCHCSTDSACDSVVMSPPLNKSLLNPGTSWSQQRSNSAPEYYDQTERISAEPSTLTETAS